MAAGRLSLCAIAKDEQDMLGGLFDSVLGVVEEAVIGVDTRTVDRTAAIADAWGARVIDVEWRDDFSYARNLTIDAARGDWILVLDADERLLPAGALAISEILGCAAETPADDAVTGISFLIAQRDLQDTLRVIQRSSIRLFRRRPEIRYVGNVHEEPKWLPDPARTSSVLITGEPHIAHYGYDPALWARGGKFERNKRLLEQRLAADPDDAYAQDKLRALEAMAHVP